MPHHPETNPAHRLGRDEGKMDRVRGLRPSDVWSRLCGTLIYTDGSLQEGKQNTVDARNPAPPGMYETL